MIIYTLFSVDYLRTLSRKKMPSVPSSSSNCLKMRVRLDIRQKVEVLNYLATGKKHVDAAKHFNLPRTTVTQNAKDKEKILTEFSKNRNSTARSFKKSPFDAIDEPLARWVRLMRENKVPVSGDMIQEKALQFAAEKGLQNFGASGGWLSRFKVRHNLTNKSISGEEGDVNSNAVEHWRENVLPVVLNGYSDDQIYNADETGLFYQCLPNKTLHFRGEKCTGGKRSKNRISVLLCTNKSGTDKLKPLVIGKSKNPRCFKNVRSLPVDYKNNQKSWMTSPIFVDFLVGFDTRLKMQRKKAILLIDNCPSHPPVLPVTLTNLEVKFLPKNTTSKLQPCDMGIIENFKRHYRKLLVRRLLHNIDTNKDMDWKPNLLDAIHMTASAWNQVLPETIFKCFRKCWGDSVGLNPEVDPTTDDDAEDPDDDIPLSVLRERLQLDPSLSFNDYLNVDRELATGQTETEESIFAALRDEDNEQNDESEDESTEPESVSMSTSEALVRVRELLSYFTRLDNARQTDFLHLSEMEAFLLKRSCSQRQSVITHFFKPSSQ